MQRVYGFQLHHVKAKESLSPPPPQPHPDGLARANASFSGAVITDVPIRRYEVGCQGCANGSDEHKDGYQYPKDLIKVLAVLAGDHANWTAIKVARDENLPALFGWLLICI